METEALKYGIELIQKTLKSRFSELLQKLSLRDKVILLIDEYDKPLIDFLEDIEKAKENQQILKTFYSIIKDSDPYIRFFLITGVSKFSKVSVFSDLNNLEDITLDWRYANMLGYTQKELEFYFEEHLNFVRDRTQTDPSVLIKSIKDWYNGYCWDPGQYVYNPFSILNFFNKGVFSNFWFSTGTPTFLVNLLRDRMYYNFEKVKAGGAVFESYSLDNIETVSLLFQTYLGQYIESEVNTSDGRIDAVVQTPEYIFIIEFKLDKSARDAVAQIRQKNYSGPYQNLKKKIILLGINSSSKTKSVEGWEVEEDLIV